MSLMKALRSVPKVIADLPAAMQGVSAASKLAPEVRLLAKEVHSYRDLMFRDLAARLARVAAPITAWTVTNPYAGKWLQARMAGDTERAKYYKEKYWANFANRRSLFASMGAAFGGMLGASLPMRHAWIPALLLGGLGAYAGARTAKAVNYSLVPSITEGIARGLGEALIYHTRR